MPQGGFISGFLHASQLQKKSTHSPGWSRKGFSVTTYLMRSCSGDMGICDIVLNWCQQKLSIKCFLALAVRLRSTNIAFAGKFPTCSRGMSFSRVIEIMASNVQNPKNWKVTFSNPRRGLSQPRRRKFEINGSRLDLCFVAFYWPRGRQPSPLRKASRKIMRQN